MKLNSGLGFWMAIALLAALAGTAHAQKNVIQPGDPVVASSANSPGSEGVANAIDGTQAKYLNRDSANDAKTSGFMVTPSVGVTWVTGVAMQSANDAADRDPKAITIEGSNDDAPDYATGTWELIYSNDAIPSWATVFGATDAENRYKTQTFTFSNYKAYKHYRWTVVKTQGPSTCCMQIAEVQLLGTTLPKNVVQPGDAIAASSANSPGSEGVANAIDGTQAKYLNRDSANDAKTSGFVVTPSVGSTVIQGVAMQSANDAADRDPKAITIEGSNDDVADWTTGTWTLIYKNDDIASWATVFGATDAENRYKTQTFLFDNFVPYKHYRWTVVKTQGPSTCCMQIAEVQFLGTGAPKNVVQPGDQIVASSANSPGSEGVANAIDGTQAKYLNRDSANDAKTSGFVVTPSVGATTIIGVAMQSANDSPDRDPKAITIEGSNDDVADWTTGTWTLIYKNDDIASWGSVFGATDAENRYKTQTFYFSNKASFKHYRWTVVKTQGPSTCCMQIAEVQFLAVTSSTDCSKASFLSTPINTPVLAGSQATFFTTVNGPWPLQWYKSGVAIPGATATSYTTEAVTVDLATNFYTVAIAGCSTSAPVQAQIFTPSTTKSVAVSFAGGGANGAPTYMNVDDIAGVQPQAFWMNATNASGSIGDGANLPDVLNDSDNKNPNNITFEFSTSGTWGAGTGSDSATARMLNGIAGNNAVGTPQTFTFHNVPTGTHALLVYAVAPPLHFATISYVVGTTTYYVRVMNSDEYKPAPGFYRGSSTDAKNPTIANFVRFDNVKADTAGDVVLTVNNLNGTDQRVGVNGLQLVLNAPAVGAPPAITVAPQPTVGPADGTVTLTVKATGENLTYQWRKNGKTLSDGNGVSGATTATLSISGLSDEDYGVYSVAVFSPAGSTVSGNAVVSVSKYDIKDGLTAYYKLDETSGTSVADAVSGGTKGKVEGTATWGAGKAGNALTFDGASTYVLVPAYKPATKAISSAGWVKVAAGSAAAMAFIRNADGDVGVGVDQSGDRPSQFELGINADATTGALALYTAIAAGPNIITLTAPTTFALGSWQHVAFTADGAQLRLYVNGVEVANKVYLSDLIVPEVKWLTLGARLSEDTTQTPSVIAAGDPPNMMSGQLDDFAVWARALTADEISKIFAAGQAGKALDTVVETAPIANEPGKLTVSAAAGKVTVTWDKGTLQTATAMTGPWTDSTAPSPVSETVATGAKFYRTKN